MPSSVEITVFLARVREALDTGFYEFSRKARRELILMRLDTDWALDVVAGLTPDDWYRDEAPWDGSPGLIRIFCPLTDTDLELWIRLREEEEGFLLIISFHPFGEP